MESTEMLTAIQWRKSSYSGDQGGNCVEIAEATASVAIRDSKNTAGPILAFEPTAFTAFLDWTTAAE
ncbi:DUF397 domain-containing protein [Streptomyces chartreusis]|uniref:DUF397 domain-containing protein n=1 Tax=Streptomyces chartreusis TaxID=1969 RepID=UPI00123E2BA6|nr:DUF397 domain-containing protein [Streptomyces chartreusis]QEV70530.1 DUF397 domain-containing protein [Streptomyces chartreusis]GGX10403.1 hypothetical protein GCM10010321_25850 [Streptomyces chartreusis]